jgi:hypothetical protein
MLARREKCWMLARPGVSECIKILLIDQTDDREGIQAPSEDGGF